MTGCVWSSHALSGVSGRVVTRHRSQSRPVTPEHRWCWTRIGWKWRRNPSSPGSLSDLNGSVNSLSAWAELWKKALLRGYSSRQLHFVCVCGRAGLSAPVWCVTFTVVGRGFSTAVGSLCWGDTESDFITCLLRLLWHRSRKVGGCSFAHFRNSLSQLALNQVCGEELALTWRTGGKLGLKLE